MLFISKYMHFSNITRTLKLLLICAM